jgi:hypothetical protein
MSEIYNKEQIDETILHLGNSTKGYVDGIEEGRKGYNTDYNTNIKTKRTSVSAVLESSVREVSVPNVSYIDVVGVKAFYVNNDTLIFDTSNVPVDDSFSIGTVENVAGGILVRFNDIGINAQDKTIALITQYENYIGGGDLF